MRSALTVVLLAFALVGCRGSQADEGEAAAAESEQSERADATPASERAAGGEAVAVFAGGCFWCMEKPFDTIEGVQSTTSGYAGGQLEAPTYEQVSSGATGHTEVLQVVYDPAKVTYERLLQTYWHNVDPFDGEGQFCDRGSQYRPAIFPRSDEQRRLAEQSKATMAEQLGREIEVTIEQADAFWPAEAYHQDYYQTHPIRYKFYRSRCGRDARLEEVWGDQAGH